MSHSRKLERPAPTLEAICTLWEELDGYPAGEAHEALAHLAHGLKKIFRADNVKWLASVRVRHGAAARREPLRGWRIRARHEIRPDPPEYQKLVAWWMRRDNGIDEKFLLGLATLKMVEGMGVGKVQVHRMRDGWIPYREFAASEHYDIHYTKLNVTDRIWISVPLNRDTESTFLLDRCGAAPHFTRTEAELATVALRGLLWLHRRAFLNHGLFIADQPMSPTSRRIVRQLLTGLSEKEIAASMNQGLGTTHKYVKAIYERYGVNGRAAFMALWLGR